MKVSPLAAYLIWTLIQIAFLNYGILFTTGEPPNFIGSLLIVLFIHVSVLLPVLAIITSSNKNENR